MAEQHEERFAGFSDPDDYPRARDVLARANFTEEGFQETLGVGSISTARDVEIPRLLHRTRAGRPLDTLIRLFFLGVPVDREAARRALAPMPLESWLRANLLTAQGDNVVSEMKFMHHRGLLLVADHPRKVREGTGREYVMGVAKSSVLLANTMMDRHARQVLDLGTGCGVLGLLAAAHSDRVFASDKCPRAADFVRFNARLNRIDNIESLTGDLFEPVAGKRFDQVICSPPYVITPTARYYFRDSGMRGDRFCRQIVREGPGFLEEGGYFQMLCNWAYGAGQSWRDGLAGWFEDIGCDVIVWGGETQDAASYATSWIQDTEADYTRRFAQLYEDWMRYYEREGIDAVSYGVLAMRRRSGGKNWVRLLDSPEQFAGPCGPEIERMFRLHDFLESADDRRLLDGCFLLSPDVRCDQICRPTPEGLSADELRLRTVRGPVYSRQIDVNILTLIARCNGNRRLREVFEEIAASRNIPLDNIAAGGLTIVRQLIEKAYLLPKSQ